MAIKPNPNESIIRRAEYHWASYIGPVLSFLFFCGLAVIPFLLPEYLSQIKELAPVLPTIKKFMPYFALFFFVFGLQPIIYRWLLNNYQECLITDERLYVEHGVFFKERQSIPLTSIHDVKYTQSIFQRLWGGGSIVVLTDDNVLCKIRHISQPHVFEHHIKRQLRGSFRKLTAEAL